MVDNIFCYIHILLYIIKLFIAFKTNITTKIITLIIIEIKIISNVENFKFLIYYRLKIDKINDIIRDPLSFQNLLANPNNVLPPNEIRKSLRILS